MEIDSADMHSPRTAGKLGNFKPMLRAAFLVTSGAKPFYFTELFGTAKAACGKPPIHVIPRSRRRRGICFSRRLGQQQIPRYARDDRKNFFATGKGTPALRPIETKPLPAKLYLNPKRSQVGTQLIRSLIVNNGEAEAARGFKIERAVVDKYAIFRGALSDGQSDAEDAFFRLARMDVAGTEEDLETFAQVKGFDAELVEFERLVVDSADEKFLCLYHGIENGARAFILLGLRENEGGETVAGQFARAIQKSAVEVFV